jgi:V8-like Glu-specific endopeptidase
LFLAFCVAFIAGEGSAAPPQVAYGQDNRIEVSSLRGDRARNAGATAAVVDTGEVRANGDGTSTLVSPSLSEAEALCPGQRFAAQPTAAYCTAFLAGPDVMVTAGHCVSSASLARTRFVFGYRMVDGRARTRVANAQIYRGARVIARRQTSVEDFAVVRLTRKVTDRLPAPVQGTNAVALNTSVYVIGHPSGLPAKFAGSARIEGNGSPFYVRTNLDTFGGNSGSPVFNASTNRVIGILVRGAPDYRPNGGCYVVNTLPEAQGQEEATRISLLRPYLGSP